MKKIAIFLSVMGTLLSMGQLSVAQTDDTIKPNEGFQKNEIDTGESSLGGGLDPFQLIHNSNLRRSRTSSEFADDTRTQIESAAEQFKRQQQEQFAPQTDGNSGLFPLDN